MSSIGAVGFNPGAALEAAAEELRRRSAEGGKVGNPTGPEVPWTDAGEEARTRGASRPMKDAEEARVRGGKAKRAMGMRSHGTHGVKARVQTSRVSGGHAPKIRA